MLNTPLLGAASVAPAGSFREQLQLALTHLRRHDRALFENVTDLPLAPLISATLALPEADLKEIMTDVGKTMVHHRLNPAGLRVLRHLLAVRLVESRRERNGWSTHPQFKSFAHYGFVLKQLDNFGSSSRFKLSQREVELLEMASGVNPGTRPDQHHNEVIGVTKMNFHDDDGQYEMHIDQIVPMFKVFIFLENVTLENGPFHFVPSSHRASYGKLKWLWDRTRHLVPESPNVGGSHRHVNLTMIRGRTREEPPVGQRWCTRPTKCLEQCYEEQQADLNATYYFDRPKPFLVQAGTMIVADTSGFHFRGYGVARLRRALLARPFAGDAPYLVPPLNRLL